jgi:hypothetical protein
MSSTPRSAIGLHATETPDQQSQPSLEGPHVRPFITPFHVPYEDEREKRNSSLQVSWSDWMAGAQRNSSIYKRVAVLLISWHQECDDLKVQKEVCVIIHERIRHC